MIRYRIDDLGWYQFEWLVQSLLKAAIGVGIESWGGNTDDGNDAFCPDPLPFPSELETGPFVFQIKFINGANAAGANPGPSLIKAVNAEVSRIADRIRKGTWTPPAHYVLYTNALLGSKTRKTVFANFQKGLPNCRVHLFGANDLCDLLDQHPSLTRSFPQLLSIRDLNELISSALTHASRARSQAAIDSAADIAQVFVPTSSYARAWDVLTRNHFVVLEGPPEMGKTAIAWMIALQQVSEGWEAIVANTPKDIFEAFDKERPQVFIADDAFGRTEYDPTRGAKWESDLHRVLQCVNKTHWLVWTSRKHVLERAVKSMDLQAQASRFPKPSEVLVDSTSLTTEEKALILYRHARLGVRESALRHIIRLEAPSIVANPSFTPERIRRFVVEVLPALASRVPVGATDLKRRRDVSLLIADAIRNPTKRMRRSFEVLPISHKWLLIALLDSGHTPMVDRIRERYDAHCPQEEKHPIDDLLEELSESFIKIYSVGDDSPNPERVTIEWIHPSYRDLVIEELVASNVLRRRFLSAMGVDGVVLALSESGGRTGQRRMPLMIDAASWELLKLSLQRLVSTSRSEHLIGLTQVLESAVRSNWPESSVIREILRSFLEGVSARWTNDRTVLSSFQLRSFSEATLLCPPLISFPDLRPSWHHFLAALREDLKGSFRWEWRDALKNFATLIDTLRESEPRLLRLGLQRTDEYRSMMEQLIACFAAEDREYGFDREEIESEINCMEEDANYLKVLGRLLDPGDPANVKLKECLKSFSRVIEDYRESLEEDRDDQIDSVPEGRPSTLQPAARSKGFDIEELFRDLV